MDLTRYPGGERWVVLLAAGNGARVRKLTCGPDGVNVPKQFYSWNGNRSMLQWALNRASALAPPERIVAVVAARHRRWWERQLAVLPRENILIQPQNRGTGPGVLFPVMEILGRDPDAAVAVMPTDHYVKHEPRLLEAILEGFETADRSRRRVVLVGIEPRHWESGYGWIMPSGPPDGTQAVESFIEKPDPDRGRELVQAGALLNSFIFVGAGEAIHELVAGAVPEVARRFGVWRNASFRTSGRLSALYETMPDCDFSRDVLERSSTSLTVVRADGCGWSDLGTPDRMARYRSLQSA